MYSKDTGKDQMLMTMERALTSGQKAGFFFLGFLGGINIRVYEGDENGNLVFEGGAAECLAWADGYCGHC